MREVIDAKLKRSSKIYELENLGLIRRKGANVKCPIDGQKGAAYVHSINDPNAVGRAEMILSYTWVYSIVDIVDTLEVYCQDNGKHPDDVYVWIYCLCVNQHRAIELKKQNKNVPFEKCHTVFEERMTKIGHIVVMMAPWQAPMYLARIWCVLEIFTAHKNNCKVSITMPAGEKKRFIEGLMSEDGENQINRLFSTLAKTDIKKAKASVPSDQTHILEIIENGAGYADFNKVVSGIFRKWAIGIIITEIEKERRYLEDETSKKHQGKLLNYVGPLLFRIAREALLINEDLYRRNSTYTAQSLLLIGVGLYMTRKFDEALQTLREAYDMFESIHGREHKNTAEALYHIGLTLQHMGENDEALKMLKVALSTQETIFGREGKETILARGEIAFILLSKKGEWNESLKLSELNLVI